MSISFAEMVQPKTDAELLKMVYELDQWSPDMLKAVENELTVRNILPEDIAVRKKEIIEAEEAKLMQGKEASAGGIILGWLTVLGVIGLFIGYDYAFSKVTSVYTQKQYFKYNERSRKMGSNIFYTSITIFILYFFYTIIKFNS
jgi:hypothetical protein